MKVFSPFVGQAIFGKNLLSGLIWKILMEAIFYILAKTTFASKAITIETLHVSRERGYIGNHTQVTLGNF